MAGTSNESCPVLDWSSHDLSQDFTINTNTQSKSKSADFSTLLWKQFHLSKLK